MHMLSAESWNCQHWQWQLKGTPVPQQFSQIPALQQPHFSYYLSRTTNSSNLMLSVQFGRCFSLKQKQQKTIRVKVYFFELCSFNHLIFLFQQLISIKK